MCADPRQHRIVVFNRDLVFKYQIGSGRAGSGKDEFNEPVDLILNQLGKKQKTLIINLKIQSSLKKIHKSWYGNKLKRNFI